MRLSVAAAMLLVASASCQSSSTPVGLSGEECADACAKVAAADCGDVGMGCVNSCQHGPVPSPTSMACADFAQAYFDCFWRAPSYVCDETVGTLATGCDAQRSDLKSCQSDAGVGGAAAGGAGAGGAGENVAGAAAASGAGENAAGAAGIGGAG